MREKTTVKSDTLRKIGLFYSNFVLVLFKIYRLNSYRLSLCQFYLTYIIRLRYILAQISAILTFYKPYTSKQNYFNAKKDSFLTALGTKLYTQHKNIYKRTSSSSIPYSKHNSFTLLLIKSSAPSYFPPSSLTNFLYILICILSFMTAGSKV